jgi:hypothetical protein
VRNFSTLIEYIFNRAAVKHKKKTVKKDRKLHYVNFDLKNIPCQTEGGEDCRGDSSSQGEGLIADRQDQGTLQYFRKTLYSVFRKIRLYWYISAFQQNPEYPCAPLSLSGVI